MQSVWNALDNFWWSVTHLLSLTDVLDILIVAALLYQLVILTKQTPAVQVLKGLAVLLVFRYVSELIHLYTVSSVIDAVLSNTAH
jgi:diadenylate cyclase